MQVSQRALVCANNGCNRVCLYCERFAEVNRDVFVCFRNFFPFAYGDPRLPFALETRRQAPLLVLLVKLKLAASFVKSGTTNNVRAE